MKLSAIYAKDAAKSAKAAAKLSEKIQALTEQRNALEEAAITTYRKASSHARIERNDRLCVKLFQDANCIESAIIDRRNN